MHQQEKYWLFNNYEEIICTLADQVLFIWDAYANLSSLRLYISIGFSHRIINKVGNGNFWWMSTFENH